MDSLEAVATLARGIHIAALLSLFGCLAFRCFVLPGSDARVAAVMRIGLVSGWLALAIGVVWLAAVSGTIAGAHSLASLLHAVPVVARHTNFGKFLCLRLLLLVGVTALLPRRGPRIAVVLLVTSGIAIALQPLLGHVGALQGSVRAVLIPIEIAHLLAAGAWLGGLAPLLLCVMRAPVPLATTLCERFTPVGLVAVGTIVVTALPEAGELIGGLPELAGTEYGHLALLKMGLFCFALALACLNRFAFTTRLGTGPARRMLICSIAIETVVVLCIVFAAAAMASSPPAAHVQPVWPFASRPSVVAWEEPELRGELVRLSIAATAGLLLIGIGLALRRFRILAAVLATIVVMPFLPSLSLLLVEAYPTSYARSTTGFSVMAIARGQTLFMRQCAVCHDPQIGGGARSDLTAPHIWGHLDGDIFWWVTNGVTDPEGNAVMPAFGTMLSEDDRWALIDFIHARNIGIQARDTGKWSPPVPAPLTPLNCDGDEASSIADLGPHDLLMAAQSYPPDTGRADLPGAETIRLVRDATATPGEGECVAATPAAWEAWRVLSGVPSDRFSGYQALVDRQGWLRAWLPSGLAPDLILAAVRDADSHPIAASARAVQAHHH